MKKNVIAPVSLLVFGIFLTLGACKNDDNPVKNSLSSLPIDTGGVQIAYPLGTSTATLGYYIYMPSGYETSKSAYPLLVFLHGSGERGNSEANPDDLKKVLRNGPPRLIERGEWSPTYPMVVVSPQTNDGLWNAGKIHAFIKFIVEEYNINEQRIYLTGLSLGGGGTFSYVETYADSGFVAAIVPISGWGNTHKAESFRDVPVWAFHGDADNTVDVSGSINMISAINAIDSGHASPARLTIYPGVGHDAWTRTYDGTGMGDESADYDPFDQFIYDWFFEFEKKK